MQLDRSLKAGFEHFGVTQVPRLENQIADALAILDSNASYPCNVELNVMDRPSISSTSIFTIDHRVE